MDFDEKMRSRSEIFGKSSFAGLDRKQNSFYLWLFL